MRRTLMFSIVVLLAVCVHADTPETVAVTYHVTPANEAALRTVIEKHFATGKRLSLLTHHQLYRGNGFFLEILTWRDESIPDNAPAEIRALWGEMERLVDRRDGKGGLTIEQVERIEAKE